MFPLGCPRTLVVRLSAERQQAQKTGPENQEKQEADGERGGRAHNGTLASRTDVHRRHAGRDLPGEQQHGIAGSDAEQLGR